MRFCEADEAKVLSKMAWEIWMEYYPAYVDRDLAEYVVKQVQSERAIERQIRGGHLYSYIMAGDVKAGYFDILPEGDELYISKFYLCKEFRGTGLGSKAMDEILERGRSLKMKKAYLRANKHNSPSIEFYERKGFIIAESISEDIGNGFFLDDYRLEYIY